jgi:hypothetical protein
MGNIVKCVTLELQKTEPVIAAIRRNPPDSVPLVDDPVPHAAMDHVEFHVITDLLIELDDPRPVVVCAFQLCLKIGDSPEDRIAVCMIIEIKNPGPAEKVFEIMLTIH